MGRSSQNSTIRIWQAERIDISQALHLLPEAIWAKDTHQNSHVFVSILGWVARQQKAEFRVKKLHSLTLLPRVVSAIALSFQVVFNPQIYHRLIFYKNLHTMRPV